MAVNTQFLMSLCCPYVLLVSVIYQPGHKSSRAFVLTLSSYSSTSSLSATPSSSSRSFSIFHSSSSSCFLGHFPFQILSNFTFQDDPNYQRKSIYQGFPKFWGFPIFLLDFLLFWRFSSSEDSSEPYVIILTRS